MKLRLTLAYDGEPFAGWQSQKSGNTVQDHLEAVIGQISRQRIPVHGSGRTDAGVHALGQVAHFSPPGDLRMRPEEWQRALNAYLPARIRVMACRVVADSFHARFSASGKHYRYRICNQSVLPPHEAGRAWHLPLPLDVGRLRQVTEWYLGSHDFRSFAANRGKVEADTVRTITRADWRGGRNLRLDIEGNGFLYKMVRLLVGAAVRVAQGKAEPEWVRDLLERPGSGRNAFVAPAGGLCLVKVRYSIPSSERSPESRADPG